MEVRLDCRRAEECLPQPGETLIGMHAHPEEVGELAQPQRFDFRDLHKGPPVIDHEELVYWSSKSPITLPAHTQVVPQLMSMSWTLIDATQLPMPDYIGPLVDATHPQYPDSTRQLIEETMAVRYPELFPGVPYDQDSMSDEETESEVKDEDDQDDSESDPQLAEDARPPGK